MVNRVFCLVVVVVVEVVVVVFFLVFWLGGCEGCGV